MSNLKIVVITILACLGFALLFTAIMMFYDISHFKE